MIHQMMPAEAAAELMAWVERRGGTFTLTPAGDVRCALDGCTGIDTYAAADRIATLVLVLRDDIRALLRAEKTTH